MGGKHEAANLANSPPTSLLLASCGPRLLLVILKTYGRPVDRHTNCGPSYQHVAPKRLKADLTGRQKKEFTRDPFHRERFVDDDLAGGDRRREVGL